MSTPLRTRRRYKEPPLMRKMGIFQLVGTSIFIFFLLFLFPFFLLSTTLWAIPLILLEFGFLGSLIYFGKLIWLLYLLLIFIIMAILFVIIEAITYDKLLKKAPCDLCHKLFEEESLIHCRNCHCLYCTGPRCRAVADHIAGIGSHLEELGCYDCFDNYSLDYFHGKVFFQSGREPLAVSFHDFQPKPKRKGFIETNSPPQE